MICFFGMLFLIACDQSASDSAEITGLEKKDAAEALRTSGGCLNVVNDSIAYMSMYTRTTQRAVTTPEIAWEEVKNLYPDFAKRITCWTEYNEHYVFSVGHNDPKTDCMFWHVLYVKKDGTEFRYFWPNT